MAQDGKMLQTPPELTLQTDQGEMVQLKTLKGKWVVLYFYPKDDTTGCTAEAKDFSGLNGDFEDLGVKVIGVSPDNRASHAKFREKHGLSVTLASDEDKFAARAFGVWVEKSMYGKKYMGVERSTFLIDRSGKIVKSWRKVKVPGHAAAVLAELKQLTGA
jgi:peroxiredoxin Q/BCP